MTDQPITAVPPGWKLVPVEPTPDMIAAAHAQWLVWEKERYQRTGSYGEIARLGWAEAYYTSMISAAPKDPPDAKR